MVNPHTRFLLILTPFQLKNDRIWLSSGAGGAGAYFPITSMGTVIVFGGMQTFLSQAW